MSPSKKTTKKAASKKKTSAKAAPKKAKAASKKAAKSPKKKAASPAKKKAAKSTRKAAARKKASPKKAATKKKAAPKKTAAKKAAPKKAAATKASPKKASAKTPGKTDAKKATKAKGKKAGAAAEKAPGKKARPRKAIAPTGPKHPKLGYKWICFGCAAKFYDLGKEEPICPKCELDQRDRPPVDAKASPEPPKPKVVRPMAQLLDEEESAPAVAGDDAISERDASGEEMFDDAETDDVGLDIDDAEPDNAIEPPEIDAL